MSKTIFWFFVTAAAYAFVGWEEKTITSNETEKQADSFGKKVKEHFDNVVKGMKEGAEKVGAKMKEGFSKMWKGMKYAESLRQETESVRQRRDWRQKEAFHQRWPQGRGRDDNNDGRKSGRVSTGNHTSTGTSCWRAIKLPINNKIFICILNELIFTRNLTHRNPLPRSEWKVS